jgi:hypothetical protein
MTENCDGLLTAKQFNLVSGGIAGPYKQQVRSYFSKREATG